MGEHASVCVIAKRWYDYGSSTDVDRYKYGYDRASNRIWKENTVGKAQTTPVYLDELYTYDGLHRLKTFDRGELNGTKTAITGTPAKEEDWTLDALGNWSGYIQKTDGTTDLNQQRSANTVNEITDITESTGSAWVTPAYDKNGNMTLMPQPENPTASFTCTYDPWNHLVQVADSTSNIAEYSYDALHRRVTKTANSETRHFLYTPQWQAIEERLASSSIYPDRQFIWGPRYIDHLILREWNNSESANGTLDERLYSLRDRQWNITSLCDADGQVLEHIQVTPYGKMTAASPAYRKVDNPEYDWDYHLSGSRTDKESHLILMRYRYYSFPMGAFTRRDPALDDYGHSSFYSFTRSRPTFFLDPTGTVSCPVSTCGEDITASLKSLRVAIAYKFSLLSLIEKQQMCSSMINADGWDVNELALAGYGAETFTNQECGTSVCLGSVTVAGRCYWGAEVNYWLWGTANRICYNYFQQPSVWGLPTALLFVMTYRTVLYGHRNFNEKSLCSPNYRSRGAGIFSRMDWTVAGWYGDFSWAQRTTNGSVPRERFCHPCRTRYRGLLNARVGRDGWGGTTIRVSVSGSKPE